METVAELACRIPVPNMVKALATLDEPGQEEDAEGYAEVHNALLTIEPKPTDVHCVLERVPTFPPSDRTIIEVCGIRPGEELRMDIGFTPWAAWLSMPVEVRDRCNLSDDQVLANILFEMTFHGFDEDHIRKQRGEVIKRRDEAVQAYTGEIKPDLFDGN